MHWICISDLFIFKDLTLFRKIKAPIQDAEKLLFKNRRVAWGCKNKGFEIGNHWSLTRLARFFAMHRQNNSSSVAYLTAQLARFCFDVKDERSEPSSHLWFCTARPFGPARATHPAPPYLSPQASLPAQSVVLVSCERSGRSLTPHSVQFDSKVNL